MSDYFNRVIAYTNAINQAKKMFEANIIDASDFALIEDKMASKYCISYKSLYRQNNLIQSPQRGNITPDEEV